MAHFHCQTFAAGPAAQTASIAQRTLSAMTRPSTTAQSTAGVWVESSWDLRCGLTVREGLPEDAGLYEWLEACLRS